jgi:tetratricopeptide (TPR) repeat protein
VGHLVDFYRADARNLRDRIARVLPRWSAGVPGHPLVLGMYAFGLEEMGDYARAEDAGREAIDGEPLDCWAHHAVAHVMEMQGRAQDGIGWMVAREPYWSGDDNFFKVHNHWHRALYHLDLGQTEQALALYDESVRGAPSAVALDLVDAAALLWRLELLGQDVGQRWAEVAGAWDAHADGRSYAFNDWHAVMAYLGAGRDADVQRLEHTLSQLAAQSSQPAAWARSPGLPLVRGFTAFRRGDYQGAVEHLHPLRFTSNRIGGSHAQRDIIDWTLAEAAVRGGLRDTACALAGERQALKPHSPLGRSLLARARQLV